jgi:cytochrome c-type biogenesis protein CcmH/NrfG
MSLAAYYVEKDDLNAAQAAAEAAVACDGANLDALQTLGVVLAKSKEFTRAAVCFERVVAKRPDDIAQWTNLGECYLSASRYTEAANAFRKAMELDPKSEHAAGRRARAIVARTLVKLQKESR